jgi:hypothetical protein
MIVTKVVEITLRDVISYDDADYNLYLACNKLAKTIAAETDIHDARVLTETEAVGYDLDSTWEI